ncbi:MAG: ABC transporter permease [Acidimicrobiales bacterium]
MDELVLYRYIVSARIRSDWQYRTSFLLFTLSQAIINSVEFAAILILVNLVPSLGGWSVAEVAFLYGLASVPFAIADIFISSIDRTSQYVQSGEMDRLLLRPVSPLVQLVSLEFELRRVGKVIPSLVVLVWAIINVDVSWRPGEVALLLGALICGVAIYAALWIGTSSAAFWFVATQEAANAFTYGGEFANEYPLHLYRGWIRAVLGWIVPLAFVAYVPSQVILDAENPLELPSWLVFLSAPVAALALGIALLTWRLGIRQYQSTGS